MYMTVLPRAGKAECSEEGPVFTQASAVDTVSGLLNETMRCALRCMFCWLPESPSALIAALMLRLTLVVLVLLQLSFHTHHALGTAMTRYT